MTKTRILNVLLIIAFNQTGLKGQNYKHSFSIGTNYTFHHLKNGSDNDNLNNRTSLDVDNNFSFQSKQLSDNSKSFLTPLYKLDLSYNKYWYLNKIMILSTGIAGSGRNFIVSEYPLARTDGKPTELPANRLYRRYYTVSVPLLFKYKAFQKISFNAGFNFNYALLESFESVFYTTNPENMFYFTGQIGLEAALTRSWNFYCKYNHGFVNVFNDHVVLYSTMASTGYPYRTNCFTNGSTFQAGFTKYFDPKEIRKKIIARDLISREITLVDSSKLELCIVNENNKPSQIDLYINNLLISSDISIDSSIYCIQLRLEKNAKYKLKLVAKTDDDVITTISLTQNNYIKNKFIWKPYEEKSKVILVKSKF